MFRQKHRNCHCQVLSHFLKKKLQDIKEHIATKLSFIFEHIFPYVLASSCVSLSRVIRQLGNQM